MKLTRFEIAAVKRTALNVNSQRKKLQKINDKLEALLIEKEAIEREIEAWEAPIIKKHGYSSEQILSGEADAIEGITSNMESISEENLNTVDTDNVESVGTTEVTDQAF